MLGDMRALLIVMMLATFAEAAPRDGVDALPEIATVKRGRVTVNVRGTIAKRQHRAMIQLVEQVIADTTNRFGIRW
jgi:hypothetical protein